MLEVPADAVAEESSMSRPLDVGAFTWGRVQRLYDADPAVHWQHCEAEEFATWM